MTMALIVVFYLVASPVFICILAGVYQRRQAARNEENRRRTEESLFALQDGLESFFGRYKQDKEQSLKSGCTCVGRYHAGNIFVS